MISIKKIIFLSVLLLIENGYSFSQNSSTDFTLAEPDSLQNLTEIKLWATQYYIHQFAASGTIPVKDEFGNSMCLTADTCNFCEAALEGTAYITDSLGDVHVINFAKPERNRWWIVADVQNIQTSRFRLAVGEKHCGNYRKDLVMVFSITD